MRPGSTMALAQRLEAGTLSLGEAFAFMSGLYFRGKIAYATAFGRRADGRHGDLRHHADARPAVAGPANRRERSSRSLPPSMWPTDEPRYFTPLVADARALADALPDRARVVLLGSVATSKYVEVLGEALGARLHFPSDFIGRGDMSRGALMLRSAASGVELEYVPARRGRPATAHGLRDWPLRGPDLWRGPRGRDLESSQVSMSAFALAAVLVVVGSSPAFAQSTAGAQLLPGMGTYSHPIQTTSPEAQKFFDQGLALLYNFNHAEAERSFLKAAELDAKAPMPWWGVGIALGLNYNRDVTKLEGERLTRAYDAAQKAVALSRGGSPVEAALAEALATRYSRDPNADPNVLNAQYREAMRQTYARYPDDPEVGTAYADAVMNLRPWQLWAPDGTPGPDTLELVKVLEAVLRRHPNHPGANHYYVHSVEASATPERALASATRLETLVPGAGHLVHMPTHIYIHTGHIGRVAELNAKAAAADEHYIEVAKPEGLYPFMYYGHNVHFVVVGNILIGRYEDALKAGQQMAGMVAPHVAEMAPMVEWALSLPTLAHVRFHKWDAILAAPRPPESQPLARSFDHYARALALQDDGQGRRGPRGGRGI